MPGIRIIVKNLMVMGWDEAVPINVITGAGGAVREVICCLPLILAGYRLGKFNCPPHSSDDHLARSSLDQMHNVC